MAHALQHCAGICTLQPHGLKEVRNVRCINSLLVGVEAERELQESLPAALPARVSGQAEAAVRFTVIAMIR